MPQAGKDEIVTQRHRRNFIQFGGARPGNTPKYAGVDTQYMTITGLTVNEQGDIEYQYAPDPFKIGGLRRVASTRGVPDPSEATLQLTEKHGNVPWFHFQSNCPFNVYEFVGTQCNDLTDTVNGWDDYVRIFGGMEISSKDFGAVQDWQEDAQNTVDLATTVASVQTIGKLSFSNKAAATVTLEVADVVFGKQVRCADCGVPNDGTRFIYAVQKGASSPATKPAVVYSTDYGATWTSISVATAANAENIVALDIAGDKLVLLSPSGGTSGASALYVSQINTVTGVPSTTFTKVTPSAFTSAHLMADMFVLSQAEVFFVGADGYIYKSTDVSSDMTLLSAGDATVSNLARIHGNDEAIYAVGASGVVIKSTDRGATFGATTTSAGASGNQAVAVLDQYRAWVGDSAGVLRYTLDGGETWTTKSYTAATPVAIQDIAFATDEVGMIAFTTGATVGRIASTIFGGDRWTDSTASTKRLGTLPTNTTYNRLAFPVSGDPTVNVNTVALGGLGTGTDGALVLGVAARV